MKLEEELAAQNQWEGESGRHSEEGGIWPRRDPGAESGGRDFHCQVGEPGRADEASVRCQRHQ